MFKDFFSASTLLDLPLLAMLGFFVFFVAVVLRTLSRARVAHYEDVSRLPLDDK